jgi:release factor glutamine methyltransferase
MFLCGMVTINDALFNFDNSLKSIYPKGEITSIKHLVLSDLTGLSKVQLRAFPEKVLKEDQSHKLTQIIVELQTGKPVQYILGHTEFYGLPFKVNPSVLIPRPETEELVEWIINASQESRLKNQEPYCILDIGTGSGCIPIALKKHLPNAQVSGLDISTAALETAQQNAELNNAEVSFTAGDILNPSMAILNADKAGRFEQYSFIVSNPPYVTEHEKDGMNDNVLNYEPHNALFVPDNDPLVFYNAIADFALKQLAHGGLLFFEINENLGKQTVDLLSHKGFNNIELRKDIRGKDRMVKAYR